MSFVSFHALGPHFFKNGGTTDTTMQRSNVNRGHHIFQVRPRTFKARVIQLIHGNFFLSAKQYNLPDTNKDSVEQLAYVIWDFSI